MPELIGSFFILKVITLFSLRRDGWRGVGTAGKGGFQSTKKSRGILEGESPRQLKFQRPV